MERLKTTAKVVGLQQSKKAVAAQQAKLAYLAEDADAWVKEPFLALCEAQGVEVVLVPGMKELAKACKVEVPTACAVLL